MNDNRRSRGADVARRLVPWPFLVLASATILVWAFAGPVSADVTITMDAPTEELVCGWADTFIEVTGTGSTTGSCTVGVVAYAPSDPGTIALIGTCNVLATGNSCYVEMSSTVWLMGGGDHEITFDLILGWNSSQDAGLGCAAGFVDGAGTITVENWGIGGPTYAEERAPCVLVNRGAAAGMNGPVTIEDDSGVLAVDLHVPCDSGSERMGNWVGQQLIVSTWSCPTTEFCYIVEGSGVCDRACNGGQACTLVSEEDVIINSQCAEWLEMQGTNEICSSMCGNSFSYIVEAPIGFSYVEVAVMEDHDEEPCSGADGSVTDGVGCACPSPLIALSQPEGYVYGPYYRSGGSDLLNFNDNVAGLHEDTLIGFTELLDSETEVEDAAAGIDDALTGTRFWDGSGAQPGMGDFLDELVAASVATDYPAPILMTEPVLVQMDFNVLAGYTTATWRTMFRNFFTGFVLLRLLMSSLLNVMWGFGIGTFEDLANYFAPVRGILVSDDVWKRHGYVDLSKREAP